MDQKNFRLLFSVPVIVAALGYFVDIYDLLLFSIVRRASLISLGVAEIDLLAQGEHLLRIQMAGLLVGGLIWGIMGDKLGRLSVLFGSILLVFSSQYRQWICNLCRSICMASFYCWYWTGRRVGCRCNICV